MTREEAIVIIEKRICDYYYDCLPLEKEYYIALETAIESLKRTERTNAHWIWHEDAEEFECSYCHDIFDYTHTYDLFDHGFQQANYCPNCGAIMDEERKDTE